MKITKDTLKQLIKEELEDIMARDKRYGEEGWEESYFDGAQYADEARLILLDQAEMIGDSIDGEQGPEVWLPVVKQSIRPLRKALAKLIRSAKQTKQ